MINGISITLSLLAIGAFFIFIMMFIMNDKDKKSNEEENKEVDKAVESA